MYQKALWCYIFILTLLDISLNTKLTAQGESHGVTIHESLVEGITFQEWGKETSIDGIDGIEGDSENVEGLSLEPRTLKFGRSALATPHSRTVTVTNTANTTLHLASVAGTTPDFHASFFESKMSYPIVLGKCAVDEHNMNHIEANKAIFIRKTLPPQGNTTFSVVYLGRREGPVHAHLYIHTSLGVHKYRVSAVGVASPYGVWPLLGVRVPANASVEPELRLHNPTDTTVQVREVYSTGAWLRLRLPGGGARAHRDLWAVPPRSSRTLVLLHLAPAALHQPLVAYVRVRADVPGGGLVLAVEARAVAAGEHARPLHVRLGARGTRDMAPALHLHAANSAAAAAELQGGVRGAGCWRAAPPPLPCAAPAPSRDAHRHNGAAASGAVLALETTSLAPHQPFTHVATLTLNYSELWAQGQRSGGSEGSDGEAQELWCGGCVRLGRATVPFSVHLLPGALAFTPEHLDVVTAAEDALSERSVAARNEFRHALLVTALHLPPEAADHFHVIEHTPLTLAPGESATLVRLRLRAVPPAAFALSAALTVHTNLTRYTLPVRLYSGKLIFEWDWVNATSELLDLGAVGTSWTRRVGVRLRNPAPVPLCLRTAAALSAALPGAAASLALAPPASRCVPPGDAARATLTVVAPAREASLRGSAHAHTAHAASAAALSLRVRAGHLRAHDLHLPPAAPYAGSSADVEVESSMSARMRVTALQLAPPAAHDPALDFDWEGRGEVAAGLQRVARVSFHPERRCEPRCYTGLRLHAAEGAAWEARGARGDAAALREDSALLQARLARFAAAGAGAAEQFTLHLHTTEVLQVAVGGAARLHWPRLAAEGAGAAPLAGVRRAAPFRLTVHNPAHVPLLLHALIAPDDAKLDLPPSAGGDSDFCANEKCVWSRDMFSLTGWSGDARVWNDSSAPPHALPPLLLAPRAAVTLALAFTPADAAAYAARLYLRNNLTILEGVQLYGRGEYPSFDIGGKRPGATSPFLFEVKECSWAAQTGVAAAGAAGAAEAGTVSRRLLARNAGRVGVQLGGWRVGGARGAAAGAGGECEARGWRVSPCAPLSLPPNASAPLHVAFAPDYSLARVTATLHLHTDLGPAEYILMATVPAKILARCAAIAPRPPWEGLLRSAGTVLAFAAFALVLAAAALDAERLLRRARAARAPPPTHSHPPLDLRGLAPAPAPAPPFAQSTAAPPAPPRPAQRRRRPARRPLPPLDPRAERRAFERWRAEVLRRAEDSSRSSEDADPDPDLDDAPAHPRIHAHESPDEHHFDDKKVEVEPEEDEDGDGDEDEDEDVPAPADEDGAFTGTGSDASTPVEDREDVDELYGGDVEPDPRDDSPTDVQDAAPPTPPVVRPLVRTPPADAVRKSRARRDPADPPRRADRARHSDTGERRATPARHHARKERPPKRRSERAQPTPPPRSPAPPPGADAGARSWSSVVAARGVGGAGAGAAGAALAPIGSDVRRREPERASDNSLFYFNGTSEGGARADAEFAWRAPVAAERPAFTSSRDYLVSDEAHTLGVSSVGPVNGGYGGLGSVWGGGGWGAWGAGPLRPPPGFAPPSPPAQRTYDPFQSLASIWAPAPHEWRPAPTPAAPTTPVRERDDRN